MKDGPQISPGCMKLLAVGSVAAVSLAGIWYSRKYLLKKRAPKEWLEVGKISTIRLYPIKSCGPVILESVDCLDKGPRKGKFRDREFVVVTSDGKMITGRQHPKMTQIKPEIKGNIMTLKAVGCDPLVIDVDKIDTSLVSKVQIFGSATIGVDCGDEVANWFSRCILNEETGIRVLYHPFEDTRKPIHATNNYDRSAVPDDSGIFTDAITYNLISDTSIKDLNTRLENPVTPFFFRPNFVIEGFKLLPYEEDNWKWVKIGDLIFQYINPCQRCVFTTVDPETGIKSSVYEPLMTLRKYREIRDVKKRKELGDDPAMGIYLGLRSKKGTVNVGDSIFIPKE